MITSTSKKHRELPRIVICGSQAHYNAIRDSHYLLSRHKTPTLVPINEYATVQENSLESKRDKSRLWLRASKSPRKYAILVVNKSKENLDNYIDTNSFLEIVIAFNVSKRFLLQYDLYTPYKGGLFAWRVLSAYWQANWERAPSDNSSFFCRIGLSVGGRNGSPE